MAVQNQPDGVNYSDIYIVCRLTELVKLPDRFLKKLVTVSETSYMTSSGSDRAQSAGSCTPSPAPGAARLPRPNAGFHEGKHYAVRKNLAH